MSYSKHCCKLGTASEAFSKLHGAETYSYSNYQPNELAFFEEERSGIETLGERGRTLFFRFRKLRLKTNQTRLISKHFKFNETVEMNLSSA